jgi:hypothetical protein
MGPPSALNNADKEDVPGWPGILGRSQVERCANLQKRRSAPSAVRAVIGPVSGQRQSPGVKFAQVRPPIRGANRTRTGDPLLAMQIALNAVLTGELSVKRSNASRILCAH